MLAPGELLAKGLSNSSFSTEFLILQCFSIRGDCACYMLYYFHLQDFCLCHCHFMGHNNSHTSIVTMTKSHLKSPLSGQLVACCILVANFPNGRLTTLIHAFVFMFVLKFLSSGLIYPHRYTRPGTSLIRNLSSAGVVWLRLALSNLPRLSAACLSSL